MKEETTTQEMSHEIDNQVSQEQIPETKTDNLNFQRGVFLPPEEYERWKLTELRLIPTQTDIEEPTEELTEEQLDEQFNQQVKKLSNLFFSGDNPALNAIEAIKEYVDSSLLKSRDSDNEDIVPLGDSEAVNLLNDLVNKDQFFEVHKDSNSEKMFSLASELCEEHDDDLPIKDGVLEAIDDLKEDGIEMDIELDEKCKFKAKDHVFKNSNVVYDNGIPKVKGPIVRILSNEKHQDAKPNDPIIMDNEIAEQIAKKYGTENYLYANKIEDESSSSYYRGETFYGLDGVIQNTHDKKMFCSEIEIDNSKSFCKDNKEKMQQQMNVVALYSIKDAKPFYYISSAEARMAIEYVSLCRKYHTDVTTRNNQFITDVVLKVDEIINSIKDSQALFHRDDIPDALVWKKNYFNFDEEHQEDISHNISPNVEELYKRGYLTHKFNDFNVKLDRFNVILDKRTITAATSIIEINRRLNGLHTYMHYIVGGSNSIKLLLNGKYQDPNLTERQLFGIVGNKTIGNGGGKYPLFVNDKINPDSIVIISNRFVPDDTKNNICIGEYVMDKIELEKKD